MTRKRKYDIGHNTIIEDDGYTLIANVKFSDTGSSSIGIKRPRLGPMPEEVTIKVDLSGRYFYLPDFTDPFGFWLGLRTYDTVEDLQKKGPQNPYAHFTDDGKTYYREILHFNTFALNDRKGDENRPVKAPEIQDYLALQQNTDREQEKRFNDTIRQSGRTLAWIIKKIGPWVPFEPDPPPIKLED